MFVESWKRAGVFLGKYWMGVLGAVAVLTALLALGLTQLEFATGQDSYLNPDSQAALDNREYQDEFGGETVILLFESEDGRDVSQLLTGTNLAELERLEATLREIPEVYAVVTPRTSVGYSEAIVTSGTGTNALLAAIERDPDETSRQVRQADAQTTLTRLGSVPDQTFGEPDWVEFLIYGNTGFSAADGLTAPADEDRVVRGSLQSTFPNNQTAVGGVILEGNADLDTLSAGTEAVLDVMETAELDGFRLTTTGSPIFLRDINDYLKGGMLTLGAAALAVMAVVLLLLFPVRWRLLPLVTVIFGVIWSFGILGFIGIDLSLVTISGLPILIGLGIDFAIQVHNRVEEEVVLDHAEHPISRTLSNLGPALVVATVAGALAFVSLQISQVPMIRDFGVMLAIGISTLLVAGIVLPASWLGIREWKQRTERRDESLVERIVVKLGSIPASLGPVLIAASVLLFVGGIALEGQFEVESEPVRWIDQDSQTVADIDRLGEVAGFSSTLGILVEANNVLDGDVDTLIYEFSRDAQTRPLVVNSSSVVNTIDKIINYEGVTPLSPTQDDVVAAAEQLPPDLERALLRSDRTAAQVNLRLAPSSLDDRAVLVEELEADLAARISALELPVDSVLLTDLGDSIEPVRAVPAGLAVVGVGLLENLSANRAVLTYLGLAIVGLWLVARYRSVTRAMLSLVPVGLAVGASSVIIAVAGISLSPLTTVSGPLVIASCTEFSVLILARYLEERQKGLGAEDATGRASRRTGRAFFTSAATTIGGFAVLIGSSLPLLRDFGIVVTLNVGIALLSALVVMPPLMVWADGRDLLPVGSGAPVRLAASPTGRPAIVTAAAFVALVVLAGALLAYADTSSGDSDEVAYAAVPLPTTTVPPTTTTTTEAPVEGEEPDEEEPVAGGVDVTTFGTEPPAGLIGATLFDRLTVQGATAQEAVCAAETTLSRFTETELIELGLAQFTPEALAPVIQASQECGIAQEIIDATVAAGL